jgi:hypothetical protein
MKSPHPTVAQKRRVFRALHDSGCLLIPNPWDVGSAASLNCMPAQPDAPEKRFHPYLHIKLPLVRASQFDAGLTSPQTRVSTLNLLVSQKTLNGRTWAWNTWVLTAGSALTIDSASSDEVASKTISATLSQ